MSTIAHHHYEREVQAMDAIATRVTTGRDQITPAFRLVYITPDLFKVTDYLGEKHIGWVVRCSDSTGTWYEGRDPHQTIYSWTTQGARRAAELMIDRLNRHL